MINKYAKLNDENIIENVILCEDSQIGTLGGRYIKVTNSTGEAFVGEQYVSEKNKFIQPKPPYESWILNDDLVWESPKGPQPDYNYDWDEEDQEWINQPIKTE